MSIIYIILYINREVTIRHVYYLYYTLYKQEVTIRHVYYLYYTLYKQVTIRRVYYLYYTLYKQGGHDQACLLFILYFI